MNKGRQATLFQSWGQKKQGGNITSTSTNQTSRSSEKPGDVIDLCLEEEDDDDLLLQAMDTDLDAGSTNQGNATNICNISLGADSFNSSFSLTQTPAPEGFDKAAGKLWIYPTNYSVRDYQLNIVRQALFKNTMVTLPTGLGKTFISAVVMYNFYRWYPQGKVIFMAPTKPLVAQQIEACYNIMGIPQEDMAEMTGNMAPTERKRVWQDKRVFFLTPQVLTNDLSRGTCPGVRVKCLVVDEAHKALGNHAYCQVVRELIKYTENFRILALSATPGSDIKAVQQVLSNLLISHIELRTEESIDIKMYSHERKVEKMVIPLGDELTQVKKQYLKIMDVVVSRLKRSGVLYKRDISSFSKFLILKAREAFRQNPPENLPRSQYGIVEGDFALAMSLYHGFELLQLHGLRSFYNFLEGAVSGDKSNKRTRTELMKMADFTQLMGGLKQKFSPVAAIRPSQGSQVSVSPFVTGHPKMDRLQQVVLDHFNTNNTGDKKTESLTRVMIFSQYRDSVVEITAMLRQHQPKVKVMSFIGQSSAGKSTKGFTQKEQLKVMKQFREGGYNTLVSTCVGEEGLDIGEVDLIICFDAHKSPIRLVQRMGRTGRKREGRIVMLVTEGKEEQIYNQSQYSKRSIHKAILNGAKSLHFYQGNPRMVPEGHNPTCHKMYITVMKEFQSKKGVSKTTDSKQTKVKCQSGKNKTSTADDGLITDEEYKELLDFYGNRMDTTRELPPRSDFLSLIGDKNEEEAPDSSNCLGYNKWLPWQNRLHTTYNIDHSTATCNFVEIVEFVELQGALDPNEDPYGQEMALFLNEDDVLKLGESDPSRGDGIRKFCVNMEKDSEFTEDQSDKNRTTVRPRVRRSVPLPELDIIITSDSDEDLPAVDFGNNREANVQENEMDSKQTVTRKVMKPTKRKLLSKTRPSLMISPPAEVKVRKRKKKKRISSGSSTTVEVIADTDNCDFVDNGEIIPPLNDETGNNNTTSGNIHDISVKNEKQNDTSPDEEDCKDRGVVVGGSCVADTEMLDAGCPDDPAESAKLSQLLPSIGGSFCNDDVVNTNINSDFCCVMTPPPVDQVEEIVQNLGDCDELPPLDMLHLVDEWNKESKLYNLRTEYNVIKSHDFSSCTKISPPASDVCITTTSSVNSKLSSTNLQSENYECDKIESMDVQSESDEKLNSDGTNNSRVENGTSNGDKVDRNGQRTTDCIKNYQTSKSDTSNNSNTDITSDLDKSLSPVFYKSQITISKQTINANQNFSIDNPEEGLEKHSLHGFIKSDSSDDFPDTQASFTLADDLFGDIDADIDKGYMSKDKNIKLSNSESINIETTNSRKVLKQYCDGEKNESFHGNKMPQNIKRKSVNISTNSAKTRDFSTDSICSTFNPAVKENKDSLKQEVDKTKASCDMSADYLLFDDSFNDSLLNAAKTPQGLGNSPSQVTFTQALACVHDSNGTQCSSESELEEEEIKQTDKVMHCERSSRISTESRDVHHIADISRNSDFDKENEHDLKNRKQSPEPACVENENGVGSDSNDSLDLPHFDLGFNVDEDIIPPSPCASQSLSQISFSSRLSQSLLSSRKSLGAKFNSSVTKTKNTNINGDNKDNKPMMNTINEESCDVSKTEILCDEIDVLFNGSVNTSEEKVNLETSIARTSESDEDFSQSLISKPRATKTSQLDNNGARKSTSVNKKRTIQLMSNESDDSKSHLTKSPSLPKQKLVDENSSTRCHIAKVSTPLSLKQKLPESTVQGTTGKRAIRCINGSPPPASCSTTAVICPVTTPKSKFFNIASSSSPQSPRILKDILSPTSDDESPTSDDEIIVRKKRKRPIIESPADASYAAEEVGKQGRYDSPFKTPVRPQTVNRGKSKSNLTSAIRKKGGGTQHIKQSNVSFALPSDDENDFEDNDIQIVGKNKFQRSENCDKKSGQKHVTNEGRNSDRYRKKSKSPADMFIDDEAMLSDEEGHDSGDEEEGSDWDEMDDSFVTHQATQLSQHRQEDLQAFYLKSIKSPPGRAGNKFRLQYDYVETDVFSQTCHEEESQYMTDSFVVNDDFEETHVEFGTEVDPLENEDSDQDVSYIGRRTRWSKPIARKKKSVRPVLEGRRRIRKMHDSSSEEEEVVRLDESVCGRLSEGLPPPRISRKVLSSSTSDEEPRNNCSETSPLLSGERTETSYEEMTLIKDNHNKTSSALSGALTVDSQEIMSSLMSRIKRKAKHENLSMTQKNKPRTGETRASSCQESLTAEQLREQRLRRQREKQEEFRRKMEEKKTLKLGSDNGKSKSNVQIIDTG